jgi:hypothetical protein
VSRMATPNSSGATDDSVRIMMFQSRAKRRRPQRLPDDWDRRLLAAYYTQRQAAKRG